MRTALMVFGTKPKKANSLKPGDKRRISLLNPDFKILEGLDARRFRKISSHCLSPVQYVGGKDRKSTMLLMLLAVSSTEIQHWASVSL